jgi:hypothetical protein
VPEKIGSSGQPPPPTVKLPLCVFAGEELSGAQRAAAGLTHTKRWRPCNHPLQPNGEYVCTCQSCNEKCSGYQVKRPDPWAARITVPVPPALGLTPAREGALVTIAAGPIGRKLLAVSEPSLRAYAERLGLDFVILDWPGDPRWPMSSKFALTRVLEHYSRIVYVDADVLIPDGAPDLLALTPPGTIGAYNDLPEVLVTAWPFADEYQRVRETQDLPRAPLPNYVNTGIMVFDRSAARVFTVPGKPIPPLHCSEQHWWVMRMHDTGTPLTLWPKECNWQWWTDKGFRKAPETAILHFSGMQEYSVEERIRQMRLRISR